MVIAKKREKQQKKCVCHASLASYIRDFRATNSRGIRFSAAGLRFRTLRAFGTSLQSESRRKKTKWQILRRFIRVSCVLLRCVRSFLTTVHVSWTREWLHKLFSIIISSPIYRATYIVPDRSPDINVTASECSS